ncbi:MAG: hypothetical protein ACJ8AK_15795 [Gemmatimonadaceae bacterium]
MIDHPNTLAEAILANIDMNTDKVYQRIGEFVVSYQWVEDKYRQIGQFILDPNRTVWPPTALRNETTQQLLKKVTRLYEEALSTMHLPHEGEMRASFHETTARFNKLRQVRNRILHSVYIEIKSGGEIRGLLRADIQNRQNEQQLDPPAQEFLSDKSFEKIMERLGSVAIDISRHYMQLLHRFGVHFGA